MEAVNTHIMQNNKIEHSFAIHCLLCLPSCKHAHSRGTAALYLLHKALHSGRRHVTFCCSKQLNRTLLLSRLTRPRMHILGCIAVVTLYWRCDNYSVPSVAEALDVSVVYCMVLTTKLCCFWSYYLEHSAIDPMCIDHYTRTVSEWTKDHTVSFGLRDMTRRFRDCLGR